MIQFDEPAFNVFMREVTDWGIEALHRASAGLTCKTAVHICYGYGIKANVDWKNTLGDEWRQYEEIFPALAASRIDQVSVECRNSRVPLSLLSLLKGKDVLVGAIDVATDEVETAEDVAAIIEAAMQYVPKERIIACTNCGMAPMKREIAEAKLKALGDGAETGAETVRLINFSRRHPVRPSQHLHQFRDLLALIGAVAGGDRAFHAMRDMVAQHFLLDAAQRRAHGGNLRDDVDAIAVLLDHAREPAHLSFDPLQPFCRPGSWLPCACRLYTPTGYRSQGRIMAHDSHATIHAHARHAAMPRPCSRDACRPRRRSIRSAA